MTCKEQQGCGHWVRTVCKERALHAGCTLISICFHCCASKHACVTLEAAVEDGGACVLITTVQQVRAGHAQSHA